MKYPALVCLFLISGAVFGQVATSGGHLMYPSGIAGREPNTILGLSDTQVRLLAQSRKDQLAAILEDSQKARLEVFPAAVREAGEAEGLGLMQTEWEVSCLCNNFRQLENALGLTREQLNKLLGMRSRSLIVARQIREKQTHLDKLLKDDIDDVAWAGQLTLDIARLRKQSQDDPIQLNAARSVLNDAQRAKLWEIEQAVQEARQAVRAGLLENPAAWQGGECLCN